MAAIAALALAGCATGRPKGALPGTEATPPTGTWRVTTFDTTWYVTSRARHEGELIDSLAAQLEYGFVITQFRERVGPGSDGRLLEGIDAHPVDSARLSRDEFLSHLRTSDSLAAERGEGAVMYVHGYATSFRRAIAQGAEIAHRGTFAGPFIVFSWPTHRMMAVWPSRDALVSRAYRDDSASAVENHDAFREAIADITEGVRGSAFTVVAHSMGAQLVTEALAQPSPTRDATVANPLNALVLFAPDLPADRFRDSVAATLIPLARRRMIYAADNDRMLDMSRWINNSSRLGEASAARPMAALGFEVVDVEHGQRVNGALRKFFEPNHAMRLAGMALYDFFSVVRGMLPECRTATGIATLALDGVWTLTSAPIPREDRIASADGDACNLR
ncbi:MAG: alpha/beta fold hydrolase [Gemmatimonadetes bacterium]|nr:alpha/beta fold hydrolase [Gemmatimonadota bacterium]